ncbi:MAG: mRNA surveillance protein pelota [archaeon]
MKLIKKDLKRETKLKPENMDDLWNLKNILDEGDVVGAKTLRTLQATDKGEKRPVYLKLRVEKLSFDEDGSRLRVQGKIISGPDDIQFGYHSLSIEPNDIISIEKEWKSYEVMRLNESLKYKGMKVIICVIDERKADIALATEVKIINKASISAKSAGKQYGGDSPLVFYGEVISYLKENMDEADKIILAGPGFTKDNMYAAIKDAKLKAKIILEVSSVTGKTGINEVIKRGGLERVMKESRISFETKTVERLLEELGKDSGLVTYGKDHVRSAVECGAASEIIISDKLIKEKDIEDILREQKRQGGEASIINSTHEAGEKLYHLGGIAAFLRYKIQTS